MDKNNRNVSWGRAAIAAAIMLVVIAGCHKVTGGGWIAGVNGGKATFAFQAMCMNDELGDPGQFEGQFQYNDRGAGVRFHGDVDSWFFYRGAPEGWSCSDIVESSWPDSLNEARFQGECTSPAGVKGTFSVLVTDNGTPGSLSDDVITVQTPNGVFGGDACTDDGQPYSNSGVIGGGNIMSHGHKDAGQSANKKG